MKSLIKSAFVATAIFGLPAMANAAEVCTPTVDPAGIITNVCTTVNTGSSDTLITYGGVQFPGLSETGTGDAVLDPATGNYVTSDHTIKIGSHTFVGVPTASAYGPNSSAFGNGAQVGQFVPDVPEHCSDGSTVVSHACSSGTYVADVPAHKIGVDSGTALGARANVQHDHSTALGADSASTTDHQVVLGTKDDTVAAPGITSQLSKDRQVGPAEIVTTDANGNLASDGGSVFRQLQHLDGKTDKAFEGVAMALAMESPQVDPGKRFGVSLNYGNFEGESAIAGAAKLRFNDNWFGNAGVGYGFSSNTVGFKAGVSAQW